MGNIPRRESKLGWRSFPRRRNYSARRKCMFCSYACIAFTDLKKFSSTFLTWRRERDERGGGKVAKLFFGGESLPK